MSVEQRYEELREQWLRNNSLGQSFEAYLVKQILTLEHPDDLHGHIVCVRPDDLEEFFGEDTEYFTQEMMEEMSDDFWLWADDDWNALFTEALHGAIVANKEFWQEKLRAEKERREKK